MSRVTGEEYRRQKELEEARKAGLAPAELDEEGREINPHIPQYMSSAPWYLNSDRPTLKHQRNWKDKSGDTKQWYDRGAKVFQATKFRKGACENCGAMSHQTKDCLERPRSKGAKWTNKNIAADEKVEDLKITDFEAKRDRWNGWDAKEYNTVVERYELLEQLRKDMKKQELAKSGAGGADAAARAAKDDDGKIDEGDGDREEEDDEKIADDQEAGFAEVKKRVRTTAGGSTGSVRNLRIREDTAKYLLNLDLSSAHYDPKSRSMREDPNPEKPLHEKNFAGDNFVRHNGEYAAWQDLALHSMTAHDKGQDVHMQANPSLAEVLYKQFSEKKEKLQRSTKDDIASKYGSAAKAMPDDVASVVASERYVEYDRMGRVVKGQEAKARSRYEEDVLLNNHTAVWGSWWHDGVWGYACCHQHVKNSYCTGKVGQNASAGAGLAMLENMEAKAAEAEAEKLRKAKESKLNDYKFTADVWGEDDGKQALDSQKVEAAMRKLDEQEKAALEKDGTKRKFNSLEASGDVVTAEEMEAWRLKKSRGDDPMLLAAQQASKDGYDFL